MGGLGEELLEPVKDLVKHLITPFNFSVAINIISIFMLMLVITHSQYQFEIGPSGLILTPSTMPKSNGNSIPKNNFTISITDPKAYASVEYPCTVSGFFSGKLPNGWHAWLLSQYTKEPFR